jgi:two-component system sensor histidine kinase AlgZ
MTALRSRARAVVGAPRGRGAGYARAAMARRPQPGSEARDGERAEGTCASPAREPFPRELLLVLAMAAPVVEYVLRPPDCTRGELLRAIVASAIPCIVVPGLVYAVYRWGVPRAGGALRAPRAWWLHAPVVGAIGGAGALLVLPIVRAIHPRTGGDAARFVVIAAAIAVVTLLPALLLQDARQSREDAEAAARRERQARLEAELAALQARTSPHFLFNTLNTVASLIHDDPDLAEATLERLAALFRHTLEGARAAAVPIEREVGACEDYLEIQAARFGARFTWRIALDPRARGAWIPPMLLQPLVENAVLHGVARRASAGFVEVAIRAGDGALVCTVTDTGAGPAAGPHPGGGGSGTSLEDLRARLARLPGEGALATEALPGGGFRASLSIPVAAGAPEASR